MDFSSLLSQLMKKYLEVWLSMINLLEETNSLSYEQLQKLLSFTLVITTNASPK